MRTAVEPSSRIDRAWKACAAIGAAGLLASLAGAFLRPDRFFPAYLMAFVHWTGVGLGCFALLLLHHLVDGRWGIPVRRLLEAGTRTFPIAILFFVPLLFGLDRLYEWARPEAAADEDLRRKALYLNVPFFIARTALYLAAFSALALLLERWARKVEGIRRLRAMGGPGLLAYGITVHFASIDWLMSLEPRWSSSIFGMLLMAGMGLSALALVIAVAAVLVPSHPLGGTVDPVAWKDLGNLLLTLVLLWSYLAFAQFLIIWIGNLEEEIPWYLRRLGGGWRWAAVALIVFHFFVPFLLLLLRWTKRRMPALFGIAAGLVVLRHVDLFWLTHPASSPAIGLHWLDLAVPAGVGGTWLAVFFLQLRRRPLLPIGPAGGEESAP